MKTAIWTALAVILASLLVPPLFLSYRANWARTEACRAASGVEIRTADGFVCRKTGGSK